MRSGRRGGRRRRGATLPSFAWSCLAGRSADVGHGLDLVLGLRIEEGSDLLDGALTGSVDEFGLAVAGGCEVFDRREARWWPFRGWRRSRRAQLAMRSSPASV